MEPKAESEATLSMRGSQRTSLRMPQSGRKTISPFLLEHTMAQSDPRILKPEYGTVLFMHLKMLCCFKKHREAALQW